ncbi:hypothetical protein C8R44DRAFT_422504 [Mycena epipterygia]|nr:hypothetical protein C8R44DRAFT_422504 [Mycena epipterygia]
MSGKGRGRSTKHAVSVPLEDSPFSDFLENDRVPSLQERKTIQELLVEKTAHLADLNAQVPRRGKKFPRQLRLQLEHTRRFIKFHQALIAPWRRLPVEIMAQIFLLTLTATGLDEADDYWEDDREGTLLVCRICRTWRAIAVSTPALWNVLSLSLDPVTDPLDWISSWLDRSRSFPVYLQVYWGNKAHPEVINPVLHLFASHLHHTAGLWIDGLDVESDFELVDPSYPLGIFPPIQPYAPGLITVGADLPPGSSWDWIRTACAASPRLQHLTTSQFALDWFPVTNMTKMHFIAPVPMFNVLEVLEHAPGLEDASFDVEGPCATSSTGKVLVMGKLSRFEITSTEHLGQLLEQIELPRLVDLSIHQIVDWPEAEFQSFLSRSSCVLRTLNFYDVEISEDQIIACLRHKASHTLETLIVLACNPPANALLQHLTCHAHPFPNPRLRVIEVGSMYATDGILSSLAESRVIPITGLPPGVPVPDRLERLGFSFVEGREVAVRATHKGDWERLRELQRKFPEFEVVWPRPDQ